MNARVDGVAVADLVAAVRHPPNCGTALAWLAPSDWLDSLALTVGGAHPGAGASTVAVALAEALSRCGEDEVTLVDLTPDGERGASEAIEVMADVGMRGWLGGRRGAIRIVRAEVGVDQRDDPAGTLVFDRAGDLWGNLDLDVLVCRGTVPSVRKAERVLSRSNPVAVAVVGASNWPSQVRSSLGPLMREAWRCGGVAFFPHARRLEIGGLNAEPLPESTVRAARRLLAFIEYWEPAGSETERPASP